MFRVERGGVLPPGILGGVLDVDFISSESISRTALAAVYDMLASERRLLRNRG